MKIIIGSAESRLTALMKYVGRGFKAEASVKAVRVSKAVRLKPLLLFSITRLLASYKKMMNSTARVKQNVEQYKNYFFY